MKFKTFIEENTITINGVDFDLGNHFLERLKVRSQLTKDEINDFLSKITKRLSQIGTQGEFLFYSNKLKQGVIAAWDAFKSTMKLITFLPRGREFPKPGTEKVIVEQVEYQIVWID